MQTWPIVHPIQRRRLETVARISQDSAAPHLGEKGISHPMWGSSAVGVRDREWSDADPMANSSPIAGKIPRVGNSHIGVFRRGGVTAPARLIAIRPTEEPESGKRWTGFRVAT